MAGVYVEFDVTEYCVIPKKNNDMNVFALEKDAIVINFMSSNHKILMQSEISKEDAIQLAKLILLIYKK